MEFDANDVESNMNETKNVESQDNVLTVISDFLNNGSREKNNTSKITLLNNASVPNTKLPSNQNNIDVCNSIIFKVGEYYICPKCKKTFLYLSNLKRHVKRMHPCLASVLFPTGTHKCNICEKFFKSLRTLQNHNRIRHRSHKCKERSECAEVCHFQKQHKCPLCPVTLGIKKLGEHFEKSHNLLLEPIKLNFGSYEKFCEWKKAIERVTKSHFVKHSSRETNGIARHTFVCHRSGTFIPRGNKNQRKLKAQGSRKMNAYCPAVMRVIVVKEGKCEIKFQSQHLGHENETKHLNLTYEERIYIAEKLATNLPLTDILRDIKKSASKEGAERLCLLTRKDLHNIKASLLKDRQSYLSAAKLDEKLVKDLKDIHDKHAESEHIKADITKIEKGWLLTFIENNEIYLIKENSKSSCDCCLVCVHCKVCARSYVCNCSDSYVEGNMCKHIHFFCIERKKTFDTPNSNDHLDCDNDISESFSNSEQYDSLQPSSSSTLAPSKISEKCKNNDFVDSEKRCALKNKFSCLLDTLTTEEEYKLFENTIEDLAVKLKSVRIQTQDKNNVVIPAIIHPIEINESTQDEHNLICATSNPSQTRSLEKNTKYQHNSIVANNHPLETASITDNKQDQHNLTSQNRTCVFNIVPATNHPIETAHTTENTQVQNNLINATNHPFKIVSVNSNKLDKHNSTSKKETCHVLNVVVPAINHPTENTQGQHNSINATNGPLDTVKVITNKQDQHNSNSQKTTHNPLVLKMFKPIEGARICYIQFAKAKKQQ